ncbi:MAG: DNA mismatch repair endonuclease MutL, partial [Clostridia bacterium]|nr:DNA mismatch repair endonuclease MutL [Clostridia bacterium]
VSFTLSNEEGEILRHDAGTLADAICAVYGAKTVDKLLEIKCENEGTVKVQGFISSCDFTKPNRTYQTAIINGRAVSDMTIQTAVERAYGDYLMKRAYPVFVLDVLMPFDEVDVNVHPRKSEVRFYDRQKVFGAVYHAVQDTINASLGKSTFGFVKCEIPEQADGMNKTDTGESHKDVVSVPEPTSHVEQTKIDTSALHKAASINYPIANYPFSSKKESAFRETTRDFLFSLENPKAQINKRVDTPAEHSETASTNTTPTDEGINQHAPISVFDGKIIGQVFSTYLLVERDEKLYIIDQHAAHERILYDRIS